MTLLLNVSGRRPKVSLYRPNIDVTKNQVVTSTKVALIQMRTRGLVARIAFPIIKILLANVGVEGPCRLLQDMAMMIEEIMR